MPIPPIVHPGLDRNLMNAYNGADLLLLHHAYNHAPNTLVLPPLTTIGIFDDNKRHPEGWDGPEGGGHNAPPAVMAIVVVIIVDNGGGGAGAND
jgi:hypothetical protein